MTAKRFEVYKVIGSFHEWSIEDNLNDKVVFGCIMHKYEADRLCELLNELHEENIQLKNSLKEFEVFESDRIKGAVVKNDDFSVTLLGNNEAYMVCNMLNRFIRSVKNGSKD